MEVKKGISSHVDPKGETPPPKKPPPERCLLVGPTKRHTAMCELSSSPDGERKFLSDLMVSPGHAASNGFKLQQALLGKGQ